MFNAATLKESLGEAADYSIRGVDAEGVSLDWAALKAKRDAYIVRLNGSYDRLLASSGVTSIHGTARFVGPHRVVVEETGQEIEAPHILIATGGRPRLIAGLPGIEHAKTSDDFFALEAQPRRVAIVGGGYIAVELAGIFNALGTKVNMYIRAGLMGRFDLSLRRELHAEYESRGVTLHPATNVRRITKEEDGTLSVSWDCDAVDAAYDVAEGGPGGPREGIESGFDEVFFAIGRETGASKDWREGGSDAADESRSSVRSSSPPYRPFPLPFLLSLFLTLFSSFSHLCPPSLHAENLLTLLPRPATSGLGLDVAGVTTTRSGHIEVDDFSNTSVPGVYAVGDVIGKADLTPVAIAAGRLLADRLFLGHADAKMDYTNIPTVIFSHPPMATCGLSEEDARAAHGDAAVTVYETKFANMYYAVMDIPAEKKPKTMMKVVCVGPEEKVVGIHMIGMHVDEMMQGFGVAMKMGATKRDLDRCVAIHPTGASKRSRGDAGGELGEEDGSGFLGVCCCGTQRAGWGTCGRAPFSLCLSLSLVLPQSIVSVGFRCRCSVGGAHDDAPVGSVQARLASSRGHPRRTGRGGHGRGRRCRRWQQRQQVSCQAPGVRLSAPHARGPTEGSVVDARWLIEGGVGGGGRGWWETVRWRRAFGSQGLCAVEVNRQPHSSRMQVSLLFLRGIRITAAQKPGQPASVDSTRSPDAHKYEETHAQNTRASHIIPGTRTADERSGTRRVLAARRQPRWGRRGGPGPDEGGTERTDLDCSEALAATAPERVERAPTGSVPQARTCGAARPRLVSGLWVQMEKGQE